MKRYRNGEVWDFEHEMPAVLGGREVILGLDGGTTSTVCICMPILPFSDRLPDPLPVLARAVAGCSNHNSVGEAAARETLEQVMADALAKSGSTRSAVRAVCLAVSGVNHPTDQQRILNWLRDIFPGDIELFVQNDAVAALASGTMGKLHGCVLIAGTGTIAYGFTEDRREARASGAGPILGDWGSGYGIAAQALTAVVRAHDGRGPRTTLTCAILQELDLSSPDELIGWTYADPSWARIAALVPVVVSCAEAGDQVANKILLDAVQELASSVKAVGGRLKQNKISKTLITSNTSKPSVYGELIPVKELAERVASYVHLCTLYWWLRPFGCGVILGGYDRDGPQLYMVEPSGVSYRYFGAAIGKGRQAAKTHCFLGKMQWINLWRLLRVLELQLGKRFVV